MKIRDLMIPDPITISVKASVQEAIQIMKINSIRHLPVVNKNKRLVGFLTLADLKQGLIPAMVADVTLKDLMIHDPICVNPDDDIEIAAQFIYKHKISGLPVVKNGMVVGILTESDILRAFIDMMGILSATSRVDVLINQGQKGLKKAIHVINKIGGDIINIVMSPQDGEDRMYCFRLTACKTAVIKAALEKEGFAVVSTAG
ncbi:MAG: CBS domain-containing protein [Pseudomonadota bacterium]